MDVALDGIVSTAVISFIAPPLLLVRWTSAIHPSNILHDYVLRVSKSFLCTPIRRIYFFPSESVYLFALPLSLNVSVGSYEFAVMTN
jgi:hypothetical protein